MPNHKALVEGKVSCRKCKPPVSFATYSELRSHQWVMHKQMYKKFKKPKGKQRGGKLVSQMTTEERNRKMYKCKHCGKRSKGQRAMLRHAWTHRESMMANRPVSKELMPVVKSVRELRTNGGSTTIEVPQQTLNHEMTAVELLHKVYQQRDFINNMTKFIEGMLTTK
jgi:hypothetical protein